MSADDHTTDELDGDDLLESDLPEEDLSLEDIEAAYLRALETAEVADAIFSEVDEEADDSSEEVHSKGTLATDDSSQLVSENDDQPATKEELLNLSGDQRLTPTQVIEGLLFVGGKPLPAKKISDVLGGTLSHEQIDQDIEQLNELYRSQNRPYEIKLVEGGYLMALRSEYEAVRSRVYGHGPKEIKLSQEVLEILAFVAYQQPVTKKELEETGKKNIGGILRQLLRRELVHLERGESDVYQTTPRFLELFGLADIHDLPQAMDFSFK